MNEKTARIGKNSDGLYLLDNGNYPCNLPHRRGHHGQIMGNQR